MATASVSLASTAPMTGALVHRLAEIQALARGGGDRRAVAHHICGFYATGGADLGPRERALLFGILLQVLHEAEKAVRRKLAERLAAEPAAPRALILALANDRIEIARPILLHAAHLTEEDLIAVVRDRSQGHRLAVAGRPALPPAVAEALAALDDIAVSLALLLNHGTRLPAPALDTLTEAARGREPLRGPLLDRDELTPAQAGRLYWLVSLELRRHILEHFAIPAPVLDAALQETVRELLESPGAPAPVSPDQDEVVEHLAAAGALNGPLFARLLRHGRHALFQTLFARAAGLSPDSVRRMLATGGESLALACKALAIGKADFIAIFLLGRTSGTADARDLARVLALYDRMTAIAARPILWEWAKAETGRRQ